MYHWETYHWDPDCSLKLAEIPTDISLDGFRQRNRRTAHVSVGLPIQRSALTQKQIDPIG
jgi:hypothetical protein